MIAVATAPSSIPERPRIPFGRDSMMQMRMGSSDPAATMSGTVKLWWSGQIGPKLLNADPTVHTLATKSLDCDDVRAALRVSVVFDQAEPFA